MRPVACALGALSDHLTIRCATHRFKLLAGPDSRALIEKRAFAHGVLALPGTVFLPNGRETSYVRASFSLASPEDVDAALSRLREAILAARAEEAEAAAAAKE